MSRPGTGSESLESILAAIRKSLAEQATDVLEEEVGAPVGLQQEAPAAPQGSDGFFQRLRDVTEDTPQAEDVALNGLEPTAAPVERASPFPETAPAAEPAPAPDSAPATAPAPAPASKDPLWFLGRVADAPAKNGAAAAGSTDPFPKPSAANLKVPIAEARAHADIVRGPLPPFFGSSPEAANLEVAPVPAVARPLSGVTTRITPADVVPPPSGDVLRGGAETAHAAPRTQPVPGPGVMPNGKAGSLMGAAADGRTSAAGDAPTPNQALEVMVAELLRPMLRRWLDENMPRLVSAALKAEAAVLSERDSNKKS
jgi:cell pole-organizing protein PopZ